MCVTTIIVNFNAGELLQECVSSVLAATVQSKIMIIDNASTDGSTRMLSQLYGNHQGIEFLYSPTNLGFAAAVNSVATGVKSDWLLILNPDCLLETSALEHMRCALEKDSKAALAGPAVYDRHDHMQRATARRFPDPWKSLMTASGLWRLGKWWSVFHGVEVDTSKADKDTKIVEAVSGACMLLRRKALVTTGYLDDGYRMHCEDLDLMYRLAKNGWHCLYVPQARAVHQQGKSSRSRPTWVHYQKHRSMLRFFNKFQAQSTSLPVRILVYVGVWVRFAMLWPLVVLKR